MENPILALGGAFLATAVLARFGKSFGLPTIPFFMAAGVIFGPHTPGIALVEDVSHLSVVASLGIVFLLFYLGLEFSFKELTEGGSRLLLTGTVYLILNFGGGLLLGLMLNWGLAEAMVIGGAIGISSSAIVSKLLIELGRISNRESKLILGIIVVEDVFVALYLALLQPVLGGSDSPLSIGLGFLGALAFLVLMLCIASWCQPMINKLLRSTDDELLTLTFLGVALLIAGFGEEVGVSEAIGAFVAGLIFAGSELKERIQRLVRPLRDAFAAIFFFAFGLTIQPSEASSVAVVVLVSVVLSIFLNISAGLFAGKMHGLGGDETANVGLTTLPRGEFSLILAALAVTAGLDSRISPFVAGYVMILAVIGPIFATRSHWLGRLLPSRTPIS